MIDREKVFKGLDEAWHSLDEWSINGMPFDIQIVLDQIYDALDLLKEQEAVEPISPTDESDLWRCGNCNHQLFRCTHQRFCEECGRKIGWEDM